jgi:hypothetical protein
MSRQLTEIEREFLNAHKRFKILEGIVKQRDIYASEEIKLQCAWSFTKMMILHEALLKEKARNNIASQPIIHVPLQENTNEQNIIAFHENSNTEEQDIQTAINRSLQDEQERIAKKKIERIFKWKTIYRRCNQKFKCNICFEEKQPVYIPVFCSCEVYLCDSEDCLASNNFNYEVCVMCKKNASEFFRSMDRKLK